MYPDDKTFSHYMNFLDCEIISVKMQESNLIIQLRNLIIRPGHRLFPDGRFIGTGWLTFYNVLKFNRQESEYIGNPVEGNFKPSEQFNEECELAVVTPLYLYEIEGVRIYANKEAWINWQVIASGYHIELQG